MAGRSEVPRICKKHFKESDYLPNSNKLRPGTVPSLLLPGSAADGDAAPEAGASAEVPVDGAAAVVPDDGAAAAASADIADEVEMEIPSNDDGVDGAGDVQAAQDGSAVEGADRPSDAEAEDGSAVHRADAAQAIAGMKCAKNMYRDRLKGMQILLSRT